MSRAEIGQPIANRPTAFVASVDGGVSLHESDAGTPRARRVRGLCFTADMHSVRVARFRHNPRASICFYDEERFVGAMFRGEMETQTDAASRELIWRDGDTECDPLGVGDPDYCVLRFTVREARTYAGYQSENFTIE